MFNENVELLNKESEKKIDITSEAINKKLKQPVKRIQSEKFLSKLNKFELLSRGTATNYLRHSSSATNNCYSNINHQINTIILSNENQKLNDIKYKKDQDLIKLSQTRLVEMLTASFNNKMSIDSTENANTKNNNEIIPIKSYTKFFKRRDIKSKSFGCEKDLQLNFKTRNISNNVNSYNKCKLKILNKSNKKSATKNGIKSFNKIDSNTKQKIHNAVSIFDHSSLIYIDDEDVSINETIVPNSSNNDQEFDDDYDEDNVIYEGDSDENNDFNDFANVVQDDYDFENYNNDDMINLSEHYDDQNIERGVFNQYNNYKSKSAPISPISKQEREYGDKNFYYKNDLKSYKNKLNYQKTNNFVYDMNLYNEKKIILFNDNQVKIDDHLKFTNNKLSSKKDIHNQNSTNSSIVSLNHIEQYTLEPLVIDEEKHSTKVLSSTKISPNRVVNDQIINPSNKNESDFVLSSSSSSSNNESTSTITSNSTVVSLLKNDDDQNKSGLYESNDCKFNVDANRNSPVSSASESASSSSINTNDLSIDSKQDIINRIDNPNGDDINQSKNIEKTYNSDHILATDILNSKSIYRDVNSNENKIELNDENSSASSTTATDLSKNNLKINYEKARRDRQIEQEQAEIEKIRLQEILDICMEFQRQEEMKLLSTNTTPKQGFSKQYSTILSNKTNQTEISMFFDYKLNINFNKSYFIYYSIANVIKLRIIKQLINLFKF